MSVGGKKTYEPDWKPSKRVKEPKTMRAKHQSGCFCVLNCGETGTIHHVLPRSQGGDDVPANLICLCGSGTTGHHGKVEAGDRATMVLLGEHVLLERPDTLSYIKGKLGDEQGTDWLRRHLFVM